MNTRSRLLLAVAVISAVGLLFYCSSGARSQVSVGPFVSSQIGLTTTVQTVKSTGGNLLWVDCFNPSAATAYLQFFDVSGTVTLGTTVPKMTVSLVTLTSRGVDVPSTFFNAIKVAATTTATGNSAPSVALNCSVGFR